MKNKRLPVVPALVVFAALAVFVGLWAGNDFQPLRSTEPPFQIRFDMQYQKKVGAQQPSTFFADRKSMREPVPGTVSRESYVFTDTSYQQTEARLVNPFPSPTPAMLARGKNRFEAFCAPCHSSTGQDTTEVVRKGMQKPPNLAATNAKGYSDARLFYVVSKGQNVMPGYADKLTPDDRWAVIAHVRALQKQKLRYPDPAAAPPAAPAPAQTQAGR
ncbi:MAG: cytochrome c [Ignavibacteriae bacterium]|nr:cytochrome c [Ignavibacteriota bacterium]